MKFIGRVDEMRRLARFLDNQEGGMVCIYGRRRIGKTRLIEEALRGRKNVIIHVADKSESALQRARMAKDISAVLSGFADVQYTDWGSMLDRWLKDSPSLSVLVIDELPYIVQNAPEFPSIIQRIVDKLRSSGQKLIICGSSQRMMQGLVMSDSEPLYGRTREIIKLEPIPFCLTKEAFEDIDVWGRFQAYSVWGGVPRYWQLNEGEELWDALRDNVFSPMGLLHDEPTFILQDDLKDSVQAISLLSLIGQGVCRPAEMAGRLQTPVTGLVRPLTRLIKLGLVRKEIPFGADENSNKRTYYRLEDPFLRFWYTFVLPNYSDAYFMSETSERETINPAFNVFLGEAWENLVRNELRRKPIEGISGRWKKVGRWWGSGLDRRAMELDVVAESIEGSTLLVGEAKLTLTKEEIKREKASLKAKVQLLPFAKDYERVVMRLFVAKGSGKDVVNLDWAAAALPRNER